MEKSVSEQIYQALGVSSDPMKQREALVDVAKGIAKGLYHVNCGMSCQPVREKEDANHVD